MGKTYEQIDERLTRFIEKQHVFFVATAPVSSDGRINLSPKGLDSFRILDGRTVAWVDLVGSGIETVAHLKDNGRIVILFCAFEGAPNLLRLHGRGEVLEPDHAEFASLSAQFPQYTGLRSIIRVACERIADSCGFGVPLYEYQGERSQLIDWAEKQGTERLVAYQQEKNARSIDGLAGLRPLTADPEEG